MSKKALIAVSFGTVDREARKAIEQLEGQLKAAFPEYDLFRAFTSRKVAERIEREQGEHIPAPDELLEMLAAEGYDEVRCQSLHMICGKEYEKMLAQAEPYRSRFADFRIGKPLLWDTQDYLRLTNALVVAMPRLDNDEAYIFMGHGSAHPSNAAYALVENSFRYHGAERVYVGTTEGFPHLDYILARLHRKDVTHVYLAPLMITAGEHAHTDLAGEGEASWKNRLAGEDFLVDLQMTGLGEIPGVGAIFVDHCRKAE